MNEQNFQKLFSKWLGTFLVDDWFDLIQWKTKANG